MRKKSKKELKMLVLPVLYNISVIALATLTLFLAKPKVKEVVTHHVTHEVQVKEVYKYKNIPNKYVGEFSVTHYCSCPKCTGTAIGSKTATGHVPKEGRTVAVDPKVIPLHSIIYVEGLGTFVAEDTGGAIKGNRLDIYINDHSKALKLGKLGGKKVKVYVLI